MLNDCIVQCKWTWKTKSIDHVDNLNDLDILEYEGDEEEYWNNHEIISNHLVENDEDEIRDLNRKINHLKIEERKSRRGDE